MKKAFTAPLALIFAGAFCLLALSTGLASDAKKDVKAEATFNKDIAPIFYRACAECHRPGEIAPMSLMSYKESRPWARSIKEKVVTRVMPPWHADPKHGQFTNDRRLSEAEVNTIAAWVDGGAKEGDPKDLPPAPKFLEGWNIGKPDAIFYLPEEFPVPAEGVVDYKYFKVPTTYKEDMWVQAAEIRPDKRNVVHHIIVFTQKGSERKLLVGYAPGEPPVVLAKGLGRKLPAGADLIFQVHYTPNGKDVKDRSYLGLIFSKERPQYDMQTRPVLNTKFVIPAGDPAYKVESSFTFKEDAHIRSLMPHMHLRGKDFEFRLTYPDGTSRILLSVPRYDFAWQSYYVLKEAVAAPSGSRIDCVAHFDNSTKNRFNPDPTKDVRWGDQTWEEMMIGWLSYTLDKDAARPAAGDAGPANGNR
ncbi:MAG TPA: cytochrome c [Blastocatellia bacterium]|nr:cytochrome c [Blastocatellia bacterium]